MNMHAHIVELLPAYALGELPEPQAVEIVAHLKGCPECTAELDRMHCLLGLARRASERTVDNSAVAAARQRLLASLQVESSAVSQEEMPRPVPAWIFRQWHRFQRTPIMQTRTRRLGVAVAAAALAATGAITMLQALLSPTPVYAIEQSIAALRNARNVHLIGTITFPGDPTYPAEIWATPAGDELETEDMKMAIHKPDGDRLWTVHDRMSYEYRPKEQTVVIEPGKAIVLSPWIGSRFLEICKADPSVSLTYGKDAETGRDCAFMTCGSEKFGNSWWTEFDIESKMPVRMKGWHNLHREGQPVYVFDKIVYNEPLPADFFEFQAPEGTEVIHYNGPSKDPNRGLATAGLSQEEACNQIATEYWQAVIDKDWQRVDTLRPDLSVTYWAKKYRDNPPVEILEIGQAYAGPEVAKGMIVPTKVQLEDGTVRDINLVVQFRQLQGSESCIIAGEYLGQK